MEPKVLVAAPTYSGKHYIFPQWYENITKNLTYKNYDWLVVDNSKMGSYATKLRRQGYKKVIHIPRGGNSRLGIARASEYIRKYAIENNYDYIMFIETDLLPKPDIIQHLMRHAKPVVGAVYEVGLKGSKEAPRRPLIYHAVEGDSGRTELRILPQKEAYEQMNKGLIRTPGMGLGCCLIHKTVFNEYDFKYSSTTKLHTDVLFYWELWSDKVPVWIDTDYIVPHYNQNWTMVKDW